MNLPRSSFSPSTLAVRELGTLILATAALAACGGGSGGSDTQKQSTATDAATAAAGGTGVTVAAAADSSASAASSPAAAASDAASAVQPAQHIAAAQANGETLLANATTATTPGAATAATSGTAAPTATAKATAVSATTAAPKAVALVNVPSNTTTATNTTAAAMSTSASSQVTQPAQTAQATQASLAAAALKASMTAMQVEELMKTGVLLSARTPVENLVGAKTLATTNKDWISWIAYKQDQVNKWFAKPRDRLDLIAGYVNDFVDPKTGAAANWSMDMPEPTSGTTDREKAYKGAWVAIQRQYNIKYALDAARIYQMSGDTKMAELAAAQLDFYADNYMKWPLRTAIGNARMLGQSLDEAVSALTMLEISRALTPYVSAARKAKWRDGAFYPIANNLQSYSWGSLNNINLWCAVATAAVGFEFANSSWIDAGLTGPRSVAAVMAQGVTQDGIWFEGSFAYNNYVLSALARLFDLAVATGRLDVIARYTPETQRMLMAPILYRFDDNSLPSPNDTRFAVAPVDSSTHGAFYRYVPTTYGMQYALANRSWSTLIDPPSAVQSTPTLPTARTVYSPDTGFATLRSGSWQAFVHYGQKTLAHAQVETLGYELMHGTTAIARDAGTSTSYGSPEHLEYFSQALGNNVPLVDGQGAEGISMGEVKSFDPTTNTLDVLQASYRTDVSARRTFKVDTNGFTETTLLALTKTGAAPRRLGVVFNTTCAVSITDPRAGSASSVAAPTGATAFKYWKTVTRQTAQSTWTAKVACGSKAYEMTVSGPAAHFIYRASAPGTPLPSTRNAIYVESTGQSATFTTSIRAL